MDFLIDPNVAYILLVGGLVLAVLALFAPGTGLIEIGALFMLLLAFYGIANLTINLWALAILLLSIFPFVLALRQPRRWIYLLVAILTLIAGTIFLFRQPDGSLALNPWVATFVSLTAAVLIWLVGTKGLEAIRRRPAYDPASLVGRTGEARTPIHLEGSVYVGGEEWSAHSAQPIPAGSPVRVVARHGLVLEVEALPKPPTV